tara:strand:+ start:101 stop:751 length:651 start_codon:yes stop_codon:yes gene_type:complete
MSKGIVFFGGDGGCRDAIYLTYECHAMKDDIEAIVLSDKQPQKIMKIKHMGGFDYIDSPQLSGFRFVYQCGNVKNHVKRDIWYKKIKAKGLVPLTNVSPLAYVHSSAVIGAGSQIYPGVRIMRDVILGENVIVLPNTVINHGSNIGDFSIINSSCVLNGDVIIGKLSYIGADTTIRENCQINNRITVGMGSLVLSNLTEDALYYGRPTKKISDNWC